MDGTFRGFKPLRSIAIILGLIWNFSPFSLRPFAPALEAPKLFEWPEFLKASLLKAPCPLEPIVEPMPKKIIFREVHLDT